MKKHTLTAGVFLAASGLLIWAAASGGDAEDPLASLSYLENTYAAAVDSRVEQKLDESDRALLEAGEVFGGGAAAPSGMACADTWTEQLLKEGDAISGATGLSVLPLAGGMRVDYTGTAVVDATTGQVVPNGAALTANHRYLVAEDTTAGFSVTSLTAVAEVQGYYVLAPSAHVDYNAMAQGLKTLGLLRGSPTAYGQGFDLDKAPSRLQAIIMFIRVLGEEDAALAWSGTTPFADVARGSDAEKYVGYAYERGYTNGYGADTFRPGQTVSANQYAEFLLRALGYSSTANTNLSDTAARAVSCGLLTEGEAAALWQGQFLRAHLVYMSCRAVDTPAADGLPLGNRLLEKGLYSAADAAQARALFDAAGRLTFS